MSVDLSVDTIKREDVGNDEKFDGERQIRELISWFQKYNENGYIDRYALNKLYSLPERKRDSLIDYFRTLRIDKITYTEELFEQLSKKVKNEEITDEETFSDQLYLLLTNSGCLGSCFFKRYSVEDAVKRARILSHQIRITIAGLIRMSDIITDILVYATWYRIGKYWWFGLGLSFVALSAVIAAAMVSLGENRFDSALVKRVGDIGFCFACCLGCLDVSPIYHIISIWCCDGESGDDFDRKFYLDHLSEFFESIPSIAIQLFIVVGKSLEIPFVVDPFIKHNVSSTVSILDAVSIGFSLLGIAHGVRSVMSFMLGKEVMFSSLGWKLVVPFYLFLACGAIHRTLSIILFFYVAGIGRFFIVPSLLLLYWVTSVTMFKQPDSDDLLIICFNFLQVAGSSLGVLVPVFFFDESTIFWGQDAIFDCTIPREECGKSYVFVMVFRQFVSILMCVLSLVLFNRVDSPYKIPSSNFNVLVFWVSLSCTCALVCFIITICQLCVLGMDAEKRYEDKIKSAELTIGPKEDKQVG